MKLLILSFLFQILFVDIFSSISLHYLLLIFFFLLILSVDFCNILSILNKSYFYWIFIFLLFSVNMISSFALLFYFFFFFFFCIIFCFDLKAKKHLIEINLNFSYWNKNFKILFFSWNYFEIANAILIFDANKQSALLKILKLSSKILGFCIDPKTFSIPSQSLQLSAGFSTKDF